MGHCSKVQPLEMGVSGCGTVSGLAGKMSVTLQVKKGRSVKGCGA